MIQKSGRSTPMQSVAPLVLTAAILLACAQTDTRLLEEPTPTLPPTATHTPTPTATPSSTPVPSPTSLDIEGEIAFVSDRDGGYQIYLMNADGTDVRQLTHGPGENAKPAWSPDGSQIAFTSDRDGNREIYIMQSDGSGQLNFTRYPGDDHSPAWYPDGSAIAFVNNFEGSDEAVVLNLDGTLRKRIHSGIPSPQRTLCCVVWFSEDLLSFTAIDEGVGTVMSVSLSTGANFIHRDIDQVGFSECCRVDSPGDDSFLMVSVKTGVEQIYWEGGPQGGSVQLTDHSQGSYSPSWSPDGGWVVYYADDGNGYDVFVMQADELEPVNLTNHPANDLEPAWRP